MVTSGKGSEAGALVQVFSVFCKLGHKYPISIFFIYIGKDYQCYVKTQKTDQNPINLYSISSNTQCIKGILKRTYIIIVFGKSTISDWYSYLAYLGTVSTGITVKTCSLYKKFTSLKQHASLWGSYTIWRLFLWVQLS